MLPPTLNLSDPAFLTQNAAAVVITPETYGPVTRWWDAETLSYKSNDAPITVDDPWRDQSPNLLDAVTTMGREPTFKSAILNGRPAVRLPVGTKHLALVGGDLSLGNFTILCVAQSAADSIFLSKNGVNAQLRTNRLSEHRASWKPEPGAEIASNLFSSNAALPRMIGYRRSDNDSEARDIIFFDNSVLVERPISSVPAADFTINQIGIIDGGPLNIDIGELVIYNKALTNAEIVSLYTSYFKPKFLLP